MMKRLVTILLILFALSSYGQRYIDARDVRVRRYLVWDNDSGRTAASADSVLGISGDSVVLVPYSATGYWEGSGDDIYNSNTGNVGINESTPDSLLSVNGGGEFTTDILVGGGWAAWTPTYTWTGGTVSGQTSIARYMVINNTVHFVISVSGTVAAGVDITNLTISLPVTPADVDIYVRVGGIQVVNSVFARPNLPYVDAENNTANQRILRHGLFSSLSEGDTFRFEYAGTYEITRK
jgi:hypothetical protein